MIYFFYYLYFPQFWIIFIITFITCKKTIYFLKKERISNISSAFIAILISFILTGPCINLTEDISNFFKYSKPLETQTDYNYFIDNEIPINDIYSDLKDSIALEFSTNSWDSVWETKYLQNKLNEKYKSLGVKIWFKEERWLEKKKSFMVRISSLKNEEKHIDMPIIITKDFLMQKGIISE